jgi:hypothetical protein
MSLEKLNPKEHLEPEPTRARTPARIAKATRLENPDISEPNRPDQESLERAEKKLADVIKEEPAVRKVVRKAAQLADLMTDQDREDDARVIREAKNACTRMYDVDQRKFVEFPDHRIRLAAATLSRAYDEGTPIHRQVIAAKHITSSDELIEKVRNSPALAQTIKALQSRGVQVEADGRLIDVETVAQQTGAESDDDPSE